MVNSINKFETLTQINDAIVNCRKCPRLVKWRESVAIEKRKSYQDQEYWGKGVPSFGSEKPKILILGLAPGAHGANRTGRFFTGDSSGDWLFRSLHKAGIAKIPTSISATDGQKLISARLTCAVKCAPPDNKPERVEELNCATYLSGELNLIEGSLKVIVVLGNFAYQALIRYFKEAGYAIPVPKPKFAHGMEFEVNLPNSRNKKIKVICSYHPSQQNTFTGKLTQTMFDSIFQRAKELM